LEVLKRLVDFVNLLKASQKKHQTQKPFFKTKPWKVGSLFLLGLGCFARIYKVIEGQEGIPSTTLI